MVCRCAAILPLLGLLTAALPAQQPAALTLLLTAPRPLHEAELLRAARSAFGRAEPPTAPPRVSVDSASAVVQWADQRATIQAFAVPYPVAAAALVGLDTQAAAAVRGHRAHWVVQIEGVGSDPAERQRADRQLGELVAELLAADVLALGCADHGAFVQPAAGTAAALRHEGALAALQPQLPRSVVVLLTAPRQWHAAALRAAAARAFGVAFPGTTDPNSTNFVVARGDRAVVGVGPRQVILTIDRERLDLDPERMELRSRRAVAAHRAVLHLVTFGPPGRAEDRAAYASLGQLLAALWGDDCLALNWAADQRLVCAADDLPERLRADDPVAATLSGSSPPVLAAFDANAMAVAIQTARERFPEAQRWFDGGGKVFVKFPFPVRSDPTGAEHLWLEVLSLRNGTVRGKVGNEPVDVADLRLGSVVERPVAELSDWLYLDHGQQRGGFSLAVLAAGAAAGPVSIPDLDAVFAAAPKLRSATQVAWTRADGTVQRFATLGPLDAEVRAHHAAQLAADVLLETDRIEHGRAAPFGYAARRAEQLRQIAALASGDYWVVDLASAEWRTLVYPHFAAPGRLAWAQQALPEVAGKPRTLVFPLDQRPPALQAAQAGELAAFALVLAALPRAQREELLGAAVAGAQLPLQAGAGGLATRIGTLPPGSRITANLQLELPR
jgi:uncharacterized protein YegJ (DUF2314 family)